LQIQRAQKAHSSAKVDLGDNEVAQTVCGNHNENLKLIERRLGVRVGMRGTELLLSGVPEQLAFAVRLIESLADIARARRHVYADDVEQAIRIVGQGEETVRDVFLGPVLTRGGGRQVTPKSIAQKRYVDAIRSHDIVFGIGPAGTGKTYLAMAMAVAALQERKVKRIILARPAVEAGEKLGFLPGDLAEKVNPYLRPLYDALNDMMDPVRSAQLVEQGVIEVAPLAFMRGRTLNDAFVILDEAQNTTIEQMKMFLTRLGFDSKAVITGDVTQVDLPAGKTSGLTHAQRILSGIPGINISWFSDVDVVRHPLVQAVIRAYEKSDNGGDTPAAEAPAQPLPAAVGIEGSVSDNLPTEGSGDSGVP
jgi:phosphate starvation-inducible PhoH-like protein